MDTIIIIKGEQINLTASLMVDGAGANLSSWTIKSAVFDEAEQKKLDLTVTPQATRYFTVIGSTSTLKADTYTLKIRLTNATIIRTIEFKLRIKKDENWT